MCSPTPSAPVVQQEPPPPPPPPPLKEPMAPRIEEGGASKATQASAKARRAGTAGLRTDLAIPTGGAASGASGLNIPT